MLRLVHKFLLKCQNKQILSNLSKKEILKYFRICFETFDLNNSINKTLNFKQKIAFVEKKCKV